MECKAHLDDPIPATWLARFGRTVAEQALSDIAERIAAPRTPGVEGVFAGQALGGPQSGLEDGWTSTGGLGDGLGESRGMTLGEALLASRFTATGAADLTGGSMVFWGRASERGFDGRDGRVSLSGETVTALLGADYARGPWLLGLALSQSAGRSHYASDPDDGAAGAEGLSVRAGDGDVEGWLTATIPYLALQASERLRLWGAMGHSLQAAFIRLLLLTGCRKSEISTLQWSDYREGRLFLRDGKAGPRTVWLSSPARHVLEGLPRQGKWVFPSPQRQGPVSTTTFETFWHRIREEAGIADVRLHDCRHTYASIAIMQGESVTTTRRLLGHNDARTTLKYTHLSDRSVREATDALAAILGEG